MGYCINTTSDGTQLPALNKVTALVNDGAKLLNPKNVAFQDNLVCVVSNGWSETAGYCHSFREFQEFRIPDGRMKWWLIYPAAAKLSGFEK